MKKLLILVLFFFTSCASLYNIQPPDVSVSDLRINNVTFFETSALVKLRIDNENEREIGSSGGVYKLYVNGSYLGKALDKDGFTVDGFSSVDKELDLNIDNISLLKQVQSLMNKQVVDYKLIAKISLKKPVSTTIHVDKKGKVDLLLGK